MVSSLQRIGWQLIGGEIRTNITGGMWFGRRSVSWLGGGVIAEKACERIHAVYGASSTVSDIIKALNRDKKNGGHQALMIGSA